MCATALASSATGEVGQHGLHASTGLSTQSQSGVTHDAAVESLSPQDRNTADSTLSAVETGNRTSSQDRPHNSGKGDDPASLDIELPVTKEAQVMLIRAFLQEIGIWCEVTDSKRYFTFRYIHSLMENKPFAAAAMALASLQQDAVCRESLEVSLSLYQHAAQSLLHYEPSQCGEASLVCGVLLSIYEMMTWETSPTKWRRHLKGCVFNLANKSWNGCSPALVGPAFCVQTGIGLDPESVCDSIAQSLHWGQIRKGMACMLSTKLPGPACGRLVLPSSSMDKEVPSYIYI